jgi:hypothetical protein
LSLCRLETVLQLICTTARWFSSPPKSITHCSSVISYPDSENLEGYLTDWQPLDGHCPPSQAWATPFPRKSLMSSFSQKKSVPAVLAMERLFDENSLRSPDRLSSGQTRYYPLPMIHTRQVKEGCPFQYFATFFIKHTILAFYFCFTIDVAIFRFHCPVIYLVVAYTSSTPPT